MVKRPFHKKGKKIRRIIQILFFVLFMWYMLEFIPSREFALTFLALFIITTIILSTGICGWLCPFGTLFDGISRLGYKIGNSILIKPLNIKYKKWVRTNIKTLNTLDGYGRYLKYPFVLWITFSVIYDLTAGHLIVLYSLIGLLIFTFFVERAWCRYACPVGALVGLIGKLSPFIITRDEHKCVDCKLCNKVCSMNIDVASQLKIKNTDCITCLDCVDVCPVNDALEILLAFPHIEAKENQAIDNIHEQTARQLSSR